MKCPYRLAINRKIFTSSDGAKNIKEEACYEECYKAECPFWIDSVEYRDTFCGRVYNELGGEL